MADQLYLSYHLRSYTAMNMLRYYERMLRLFPYSKLSQSSTTLQVSAVSFREPPLFEAAYKDPIKVDDLIPIIQTYRSSDAVIQLEPRWDIWQFDRDWKLSPYRVRLLCFGPEFEEAEGEHLRIEFGVDANFLPQPELPDSVFMAQSNLRSLLHLVHSLDNALSPETRRLWTESGQNFSEILQEAVEEI